MIDERLMQPGRWDIRLKPETPLEVRASIVWRDHFAVVPGRLQFPTYDQVRTAAIYAGVVLSRKRSGPQNPVEFGGLNLLYWLGDTTMGTPTGLTTGSRSATITTLLNELWTYGNTVGDLTLTLSTVPATTVIDVIEDLYRSKTTMQLIDRWRRKTNPVTEFALRHDGELVFSQEGGGTAFVQTPTLTITRDGVTDRPNSGRHVVADRIEEDADAFDEDYRIAVKSDDVLSTGEATNSDFSGRLSYPLDNNSNAREMYQTTTEVTGAGAAQDFACSYIAASSLRLQRRRLAITLPAGSIIPNVDLAVGDYVYLYDPWTGSVDNTNKVVINGQQTHPQKVRITGMSWDPPKGSGIYWMKTQSGLGSGSGSYPENVADITQWVDNIGGPIKLTVDTAPPLRPPAFRSARLS